MNDGRIIQMAKRGRPPMTEEAKAAARAARAAAGNSAAAATKPVPAQAREAKPDRVVSRSISKANLEKLLKMVSTCQADMDEAKSTMGGCVNSAVESQHLHKGAFAFVRKLVKMDQAKRTELLFHLDTYRKYLGFDDTSDLLRGDAGESLGMAPPPDDDEGDDGIPFDEAETVPRGRGTGFSGEDLNEGRIVGFPAAGRA